MIASAIEPGQQEVDRPGRPVGRIAIDAKKTQDDDRDHDRRDRFSPRRSASRSSIAVIASDRPPGGAGGHGCGVRRASSASSARGVVAPPDELEVALLEASRRRSAARRSARRASPHQAASAATSRAATARRPSTA